MIVAKYLSRSHFLSVCYNMTVKQHITTEPFKKYDACTMTFFISLTLCHTFSILLHHLPCVIPMCCSLVSFTINNKLEWEKRRFFVYLDASSYHVISKEIENRVFRHNRIFRVCINNPCWKIRRHNNFVHIVYNYLRYTYRLLDVFFFLLAVILSEFHENPRRKD